MYLTALAVGLLMTTLFIVGYVGLLVHTPRRK